jgi:hypothetical protein
MKNAVPENKLQTTSDWSYLASVHCGANWFLAGESGGFADPILSAGLTMTHVAAREAAFTILEDLNGGDREWLRQHYSSRQSKRILSHIRFADYWYSANGQFTDLKDYTASIAREAGLDLDPERAWWWLAQGGFIDDEFGATAGSFELPLVRALGEFVGSLPRDWCISGKNVLRANLENAEKEYRPRYFNGRVQRIPAWVRDGRIWPLFGAGEFWHSTLGTDPSASEVALALRGYTERVGGDARTSAYRLLVFLEALVADGWVTARYDPGQPDIATMSSINVLHAHVDAGQEAGTG